MANLQDLICTAPNGADGVPTGYANWRLAIQIGVAQYGAHVMHSKVGTAKVSDTVWLDVTSDVEHVDFTRGTTSVAAGFPKPQIGTANIRLANNSNAATPYEYSLWNTNNINYNVYGNIVQSIWRDWGAGALMRIVLFKPGCSTSYSVSATNVITVTRTNWQPLFTGFVETWNEVMDNNYDYIDITCAETLSFFSDVQTTAVTAVGADDTLTTRVNRLSLAAGWQLGITQGTDYVAYAPYEQVLLQPTTMSANRLQELVLSGDSVKYQPVFSGRDGSIQIGYKTWITDYFWYTNYLKSSTYYSSQPPTPATPAYYVPPINITANSDFVVNDTSMQLAGSATPAGTDANYQSQSKYGIRSVSRTDLICKIESDGTYNANLLVDLFSGVEDITAATPAIYGSTDQSLQPGAITITDNIEVLRTIDFYDTAVVDNWFPNHTDVYRFYGRVMGYTVALEPMQNRISTTITITMHASSSTKTT